MGRWRWSLRDPARCGLRRGDWGPRLAKPAEKKMWAVIAGTTRFCKDEIAINFLPQCETRLLAAPDVVR